MIFLSPNIYDSHIFHHPAANLTAALGTHNIPYRFLPNTKDIWVRDFMPVRTRSGKLVSFRYEPSYLRDCPALRTDFRRDIAPQLALTPLYADINLDGGNVVFSPSGARVLISDRVFSETRSARLPRWCMSFRSCWRRRF